MFGWEGDLPEPSVRMVSDMQAVLKDPECSIRGPLYFMYRDLARTPEDREWLKYRKLRYDITVRPSRVVCGERVKTKGHHHPKNLSGVGYPEVYEVLEGEAHYLIQKRDMSDIVLIEARKGDIVIIPPSYGHVTINPGNSRLVMANIVSNEFSSEYNEYEEMRGAAYYELADGSLIRNRAYPDIPILRRFRGEPLAAYCTLCRAPLYSLVGNDKDALEFLNRPERYLPELTKCLEG